MIILVRFCRNVRLFKKGISSVHKLNEEAQAGEKREPQPVQDQGNEAAASVDKAKKEKVQGWAMPPRTLLRRISFLTTRFELGEEYWQFVLWLRQGVLFALTALGEWFWGGIDPAENPTLFLSTLWWQGSVALLTVLIFLVVHRCRQPYAFGFQNKMESLLFLAQFILLFLGTLYTSLDPRWRDSSVVDFGSGGPAKSNESDVHNDFLLVLEFIMIGIVGASLVSVLVFSLYDYCRSRKSMMADSQAVDQVERADGLIDKQVTWLTYFLSLPATPA